MAESKGGDASTTLIVEATPQQKALLGEAAEACGLTLEEFVLKAAVDAAEQTMTV